MGRTPSTTIRPEAVEAYLKRRGHNDARVTRLEPLGMNTQAGLKAYGYGRPLRVTFTSDGKSSDVVVRTMSPDPFGHNRRSDRVENMVLSFDTFNTTPRHIRSLDVGTFDEQGELVSFAGGEPFLVTTYVDGELYASDLAEVRQRGSASPLDVKRARALGSYLAELHGETREPRLYLRSLRDTVGSSEGISGQLDGYPAGHKVGSAARLQKIEESVVRWRWRLRDKSHRARRTHGDFHPFNILFRDDVDFSVLDLSRGGSGEPADDVTCLSINYLFFALAARGRFDGGERELWRAFWDSYMSATNDPELLEVVAPFFTWRVLVVASPVWYPQLDDAIRERLFTFAERLLGGATFHPDRIDELIA